MRESLEILLEIWREGEIPRRLERASSLSIYQAPGIKSLKTYLSMYEAKKGANVIALLLVVVIVVMVGNDCKQGR